MPQSKNFGDDDKGGLEHEPLSISVYSCTDCVIQGAWIGTEIWPIFHLASQALNKESLFLIGQPSGSYRFLIFTKMPHFCDNKDALRTSRSLLKIETLAYSSHE